MATTSHLSTEAINDAANRRLTDEVWSAGSLAACDELVDPEWVLHQPGAADPGHGPAGYRTWVAGARAAFPDFQLSIEEQFVLGDRVATRFTMRGTHLGDLGSIPASGTAAVWTSVSIKRYRDGKVAETWICTDGLSLLRQVGVIPGATGPAGW